MLYKINRTTCEKVRSQMKKAQKINRRATLIWAMRRVALHFEQNVIVSWKFENIWSGFKKDLR